MKKAKTPLKKGKTAPAAEKKVVKKSIVAGKPAAKVIVAKKTMPKTAKPLAVKVRVQTAHSKQLKLK